MAWSRARRLAAPVAWLILAPVDEEIARARPDAEPETVTPITNGSPPTAPLATAPDDGIMVSPPPAAGNVQPWSIEEFKSSS